MITHTQTTIEYGGGVFFKIIPAGTRVTPTIRKNGYQLANHAELDLNDWYAPCFIKSEFVE